MRSTVIKRMTSGRMPIVALCLIVIGMSITSFKTIAMLTDRADQHSSAILELHDLQSDTERMNRTEERLTSGGAISATSVQQVYAAIDAHLATLAQLISPDRFTPIATDYGTYQVNFNAALEQREAAGPGADLSTAHLELVGNGDALLGDIGAETTRQQAEEGRARKVARFWLAMSRFVSAALVCGLLLVYEKYRRKSLAVSRFHAMQLRTLLQQSTDLVMVTDVEGRIRFATPATEVAFGGTSDQILGQAVDGFLVENDRAQLSQLIVRAIAGNGAPVRAELRFARADTGPRIMDVAAVDLIDNPAVNGIVLTAHDITERKVLLESLHHQAHHDSLTSLPNRMLLTARLEQALAAACATEMQIALLFVDLNDFKVVNDLRGHAVGDELLIAASVSIQSAVRTGDIVARLGGDEFVVLLEDTNRAGAEEAAARIEERLRATILQGQLHPISASIGIAVHTGAETSADELLCQADAAMYESKLRHPMRASKSVVRDFVAA
jgi:diguanylate cyclase (GGDEF)-like protein/PAS domain S-box-containing protein